MYAQHALAASDELVLLHFDFVDNIKELYCLLNVNGSNCISINSLSSMYLSSIYDADNSLVVLSYQSHHLA